MKNFLIKLNTCDNAKEWALNKDWKTIYKTCPRGDWLLWLFRKVNPNDLQVLTLTKGHCAATVLHLMKDERSKKAVQAAIDFGNNIITKEQLKNTAVDAVAAANAAAFAAAANAADYAAYAAYAANAATNTVDYAAYAAYAAADAAATAYAAIAAIAAYAANAAANAANAANAAYAAAIDAKTKNQLLTANICRKYLPIEIWNIPII